MGKGEYVTIEVRGNDYLVAHHSSSVRQARSVRCRSVHEAWEVAKRVAAARGGCEIRVDEGLGACGRVLAEPA
jgi:hypothetical protein